MPSYEFEHYTSVLDGLCKDNNVIMVCAESFDIYGISKEERTEKIKKYAEMFGITKDLAQPISSYSHGMKQKLALISALIHSPKLLVMDEPFVGLDPKAAHLLKEEMKQICENGGAIFFSTHVLEVAEKICDKIAIIKSGQLVVSGEMSEVKGNTSLENVFLELEGTGDFKVGE